VKNKNNKVLQYSISKTVQNAWLGNKAKINSTQRNAFLKIEKFRLIKHKYYLLNKYFEN